MTKKSDAPAIRFKGFSDAWEQRKLGELGTITTGNTPSTSIPDYYSDDGIVWVTPTDICENITFESARKLSDLGQQVGRVVPKNTILVTCIASIGKNTMLGNTGSFNQQINGLTPNENKYDPYFLLTESALWSAKMKGSAAAGTMQIVNRTEFSELKTWLPSLIEQQAIGAFFKQLDHLITLHQRKFEKLTNVKKSMLEKMFPQNGSSYPEIRFKGFTDPWEQRKLSDVAGVHDGVHQTPDYQDEGIMFLSVENIATMTSEKYISEEAYERDYKVRPEKGDILMTRIGDVGTPNVVETDEKLAYYVSLALLKPKGIDSYFLNNAIQSSAFQHGLRERTLLTAIPMKINKDEIGKVDISFPTDVNEQRKIGESFKQLDNLITLHQRELEKLQNIKKSMLEKMFV